MVFNSVFLIKQMELGIHTCLGTKCLLAHAYKLQALVGVQGPTFQPHLEIHSIFRPQIIDLWPDVLRAH